MSSGPDATPGKVGNSNVTGRVCYLVFAHNFPQQVEALVYLIRSQSDAPIYLHVDRKSRAQFRGVLNNISKISRVAVSSDHLVWWGGFSIVKATLDCVSRAFELFNDITHVKLMSGLDFPVRPLADFEAFVRAAGECSIIDYNPLPWVHLAHDGGLSRIQYPHFVFWKNHFLRVPLRKKLPDGKKFYHGSQFWCISRSQFLALQRERDENRKFFRWSLIPDEMYFQTALKSIFDDGSLLNFRLTFSKWSDDGQGPFVLDEKDLETARELGYFFARKFFVKVDTDRLDISRLIV